LKKVTLADVLPPSRYAPVRDARRQRVIALKKLRRVSIGPQISLLFENRDTVISQIEEMCRAEALEEPAKIQAEIDVYNQILPADGALGATLFIELTSERAMQRVLDDLVGLQEHVWFVAGGVRVRATFDAEQFAADKLAAVQYLQFPLTDEARAALRTAGAQIAVAIDHPRYRHEARLDEPVRAELARDLS